jgi:hypothetical protein
MIYGIAILCARSGRHYFSREHVVGFGIPGESGLADAINFAGMIFALDCNCRDLQFSERHQEPVFKSVQTAERTLLVRHHFSFPVMAAVVAPPSTPLQLLGEFASEMLQAWVVSHAPSDPGGVPKRGFKTTYTTVLRSLVSRHVDAAFQAFGPSASWMMVARSNGVAGLCDAASAGIDSTANSTKSKAAQPVRVKRSNSLSSSPSALSVVPKASGFFSRLKSGQDPLLKQINGPAFGRSCCVRTSSSAAPPSADTQQVNACFLAHSRFGLSCFTRICSTSRAALFEPQRHWVCASTTALSWLEGTLFLPSCSPCTQATSRPPCASERGGGVLCSFVCAIPSLTARASCCRQASCPGGCLNLTRFCVWQSRVVLILSLEVHPAYASILWNAFCAPSERALLWHRFPPYPQETFYKE